MKTNTRTDKSFKNLASFSEEVLVQCPCCPNKAKVFAEHFEYQPDQLNKTVPLNLYFPPATPSGVLKWASMSATSIYPIGPGFAESVY